MEMKKKEAFKEYITGSDNEWKVHAEDGKVLGTHSTKADATKQLQAIEINKHKESTNVNENAKTMFNKEYKDLTPEEKQKVDDAAMVSYWLGESFKGSKKETATSNDEDGWMRKMFKAGATPEEIAGVFKIQYGRDLPVSQVRYTVLGPGGFAPNQEKYPRTKDEVSKKMFGKSFDELTEDEKKDAEIEYGEIMQELSEKLVYTQGIGQDIFVVR